MKKEMFKDRYGLTEAVLSGRKTMKRVIPHSLIMEYYKVYEFSEKSPTLTEFLERRKKEYYSVGEEVAVAQCYEDILLSGCAVPKGAEDDFKESYIGYRNKLYVKSEYMPHRIVITDIRVERLHDISEEDCLSEGVIRETSADGELYKVQGIVPRFKNARDAFAVLFDRVCGKGSWQSNPHVFVYSFKLVR